MTNDNLYIVLIYWSLHTFKMADITSCNIQCADTKAKEGNVVSGLYRHNEESGQMGGSIIKTTLVKWLITRKLEHLSMELSQNLDI